MNGDNKFDQDDDDEVNNQYEAVTDYPEPQTKQPPKFEVPSSEKKVGFMFANTDDKFQISLAQQAFDNIVGSESIIKLSYASDNAEDNMEESVEEHYEHGPIVILQHAIMTISIDKSDNKSSANHYYEATVYKLRRSRITGTNEFILLYDANKSINLRLGRCNFMQMLPHTFETI